MEMKKALKSLYAKIGRIFPLLYYIAEYKRASYKIRSTGKSREQLFQEFISRSEGKKCLQIGVKDSIGEKFGANWVSIDKYDEREFIDFNYDIHDMEFEDETFDAVVCWSILEHLPNPQKAISELHRVLKPGGEIWVQLPFLYPYHEAPKDYWRVTPDGLRIWLKDFKEHGSGVDFWARTTLIAATYYYGTK